MSRARSAHGRREAATPALAVLEDAGVEHTVLEVTADLHDRGERYGVQAARSAGVDPATMAKTLMVSLPDGSLAACLVPVDSTLDLKAAAAALGVKKAVLADLAVAERRTGYVRGGISPLGQRQQAPVLMDSSLTEHEAVCVSAGVRGRSVRLAPGDLLMVTGARTVPLRAAR